MKRLILILAAVAVSHCDPLQEAWMTFKIQFNKNYDTIAEDEIRFKIFVESKTYVDYHNTRFLDGKETYTMELNELADLTDEEFRERYLGFEAPCVDREDPGTIIHNPPESNDDLPDIVDWRAEGAVTPVKNQGQCGSCWAFSAVGALEGQHFRQTGELVNLSEQNLVDCTRNMIFGNNGCNGGFMNRAFRYIKKKGIDTEESYPYRGKEQKCKFSPENIGANMTGYAKIKRGSQLALQDAVAKAGPISVAIEAHKSIKYYKSGVYYEPQCGVGFQKLNHAVLVVGYGVEDGREYWLVKNSWGDKWGDGGYIKIVKNFWNGCGVAEYASYPVVDM
uniref:Cathepsin L n=1 Tax=Riptortus pedestris TaxID=329032 RepID=R4WI47_RIPPE|nr:cathepsin L [Riptortus pedestris]